MKYIKEFLLFSYIFVIYFYYIIEYSFLILHGIGLLFSLVMIYDVLLRKEKIKINFFLVLFFINILWFVISYFWSIDQEEAFSIVRILISIFIFSFFLYNHINETQKAERILAYFGINTLLITIYALVTFEYIHFGLRRFDSAGNPNYISILVFIGLIISFYFVLQKKQYYYAIILPVGLLYIFLAGSRKVMIGLILVIFLFALLNYNFKKVFKRTIISILLIIIAYQLLANVEILQPTYDRMNQFINSISGGDVTDGSLTTRNTMINRGIEYIGEKPFIGHGVGQYRFIFEKETGTEIYSHNNFVEIGVNNGLIGLIFYYSMFFYIFLQFYYFNLVRDELSKVLLIIVISIFIFGYGEVQYYSYPYYILLIIATKVFYLKRQRIVD